MSENLSCCFTGLRPQKFTFDIESDNPKCAEFENDLTSLILKLINNGCDTFYSGMAMGFDIIAAETVLEIKDALKDYIKIKLICAIPFPEQSKSFPNVWKKRYDKILKQSDDIVLVSDNYYPSCYMKRNRYMVDNSDFVVTYFNGKNGGTKSTVQYAEKKQRKIFNLF